jgi:hypothetical protein
MKRNISIIDFVTDPQLLGLSISKPQETLLPIDLRLTAYEIDAGHLAAVHLPGDLPEIRVQ